ncbi:MAG TPA: hypothetical protein VF449_08075, partial [Parvibaculum sp.]
MNFSRIAAGIALVACSSLLAGCVSPAQNVAASADIEQAVRAHTPPQKKARVQFYLGEWNGAVMVLGPIDNKQPADLLANGQTLGGVNPGQVLVVDLVPGKYEFAWHERAESKTGGLTSPTVSEDLHPGDLLYLRADIHQTAGALFGIIGAIAAPPEAVLRPCPTV